jgi:DNA-binding response OmpR family regulator
MARANGTQPAKGISRHFNQSNEKTLMKTKILVIDDDHSVRASLVKLLEMEDYEVVEAGNGAEGIDIFRSSSLDLVVLDVNLAEGNGWSVFETMKELNPFVPTIVITAEFDQRENAVAAGAEALIEKPLDVAGFLEIVHNLLTETSDKRLERVCGDDEYCRFVAGYHAPYLSRLDERHSVPLTLSGSLRTALGINISEKNPRLSADFLALRDEPRVLSSEF